MYVKNADFSPQMAFLAFGYKEPTIAHKILICLPKMLNYRQKVEFILAQTSLLNTQNASLCKENANFCTQVSDLCTKMLICVHKILIYDYKMLMF